MNPLKRNIFQFRGVPKKNQPDTPSKWQRFINTLLPWLEHKKAQGETYLQAVVAKEIATAIDTMASAEVKHAEAEKLRAETELLRLQAKEMAENAAKKDETLFSQNTEQGDLEEELSEFTDFLKAVYHKYGVKVSIKPITDEEGKIIAYSMDGEKPIYFFDTDYDLSLLEKPADE